MIKRSKIICDSLNDTNQNNYEELIETCKIPNNMFLKNNSVIPVLLFLIDG